MATGDTILSFKNVSFEYQVMKPVLNSVSFNIKEGSKVTIMGQNGAGKSTILKLMNETIKPSEGTINIKHRFALSTAMQVISTEDRERTVLEFFLHHLHNTSAGIHSRIATVLQKVGLEASHDRLVKSFSGGQQARLLLASALVLEPDILLLDEPTNNLDVQGIDMLRSLILESEKTCVVISHDEKFLNSFTDSVLYLDNHSKKVEYYDGNYDVVKREIAARIARENSENARLQKDALQKKAQANVFANKVRTVICLYELLSNEI
jgi:ATP-binding cassette, subfamily F, member 3